MTRHMLWESQMTEESSVPLDGVLSVVLGGLMGRAVGQMPDDPGQSNAGLAKKQLQTVLLL